MKIPIVMAAFGTTTRALETYAFIDEYYAKGALLWRLRE